MTLKQANRLIDKELTNLEYLIIVCGVEKTVLAERMNMPYSTFYRKLKKKRFSVKELILLFEKMDDAPSEIDTESVNG